MSKEFYFYDAAGNRKRVKEFYFYDGAGNRKKVKAGYFYDAAGNRRQFFVGGFPVNLAGTLTGVVDGSITGYRDGLEGDLTPSISFANGGYVTQIYSANAANSITLKIGNLPSDPGKPFFTTLEFNDGITILNSASATYSYNDPSKTATWTFTSTLKLTGSRLMEIFL